MPSQPVSDACDLVWMDKTHLEIVLINITMSMAYTLEDLKEYVKDGDNESAHSAYDALIEEIAEKYEPETVKKLRRITKDTNFWYA